jgi:hypothetical protein
LNEGSFNFDESSSCYSASLSELFLGLIDIETRAIKDCFQGFAEALVVGAALSLKRSFDFIANALRL